MFLCTEILENVGVAKTDATWTEARNNSHKCRSIFFLNRGSPSPADVYELQLPWVPASVTSAAAQQIPHPYSKAH